MAERSPIFSAKYRDQQIGFIEGARAFDLSAKPCAIYEHDTGLLRELQTQKIVGYVSFEGFLAGSSWITEKLFGATQDGGFPQQEKTPDTTSPEAAAAVAPSAPIETPKTAPAEHVEMRASNPQASPDDQASAQAQTAPHQGDPALSMTSQLEENSSSGPEHAEDFDNGVIASSARLNQNSDRASSDVEPDSGADTSIANEMRADQSADAIVEPAGPQSPGTTISAAVSSSHERDLESAQQSGGPNDSGALMVVRSFMQHVSDYLHSTGEAIAAPASTHKVAEQQPSPRPENCNDAETSDAQLTGWSSPFDRTEVLPAEQSLPADFADLPNAPVRDEPLPVGETEVPSADEQARVDNKPRSEENVAAAPGDLEDGTAVSVGGGEVPSADEQARADSKPRLDEDVAAASGDLEGGTAVSVGRTSSEQTRSAGFLQGKAQGDEASTQFEQSSDSPSSAPSHDAPFVGVNEAQSAPVSEKTWLERELQRALNARQNELELHEVGAPREKAEVASDLFPAHAKGVKEISQSEAANPGNLDSSQRTRLPTDDPNTRENLEHDLKAVLKKLEEKSQ